LPTKNAPFASELGKETAMPLLKPRSNYRPFEYQFAFDAYLLQNQAHWLATEVPMAQDKKDYHALPDAEKFLITQVFRFFTQGDIEVSNNYQTRLMPVFQVPEVAMMLGSFANAEAIHIHAYSYLLDSLELPETEYSAFLQYDSMRKKYDYLHGYKSETLQDLAKTLAVFGAFTEGTALFASFAILLNFQRMKVLNGMGQIVSWSVRDESCHSENICTLYRTLVQENPELQTEEHRAEIEQACRDVVEMEDAFIDTCFSMGAVRGLDAADVKGYIRYISNIRMQMLGFSGLYEEYKNNPMPWIEDVLGGREHANFFETKVTEYNKAVVDDSWPE
jgi:ribonucleoside-diphosphate reductase beta chain